MIDVRTIQGALRGSIARNAERVGPFTVTIDPDATGPFRNFAILDDAANPTAGDVDALIAFFSGHDRLPRLEFTAPAPAVERVLDAAGFVTHNRLPLLVLPDAGALAERPTPDGVVVDAPAEDDRLRALAAMQNAAYGEAGVSDADVARLRATIGAGGVAVAAWQDGTVVAGGVLGTPRDGLAEIYAVATADGHRRRGLASAVAVALTRAALDRGVTPYLQTEGSDEQRLYERIGYRRIGELIDSRGPVTTDHRAPTVIAGEAEHGARVPRLPAGLPCGQAHRAR